MGTDTSQNAAPVPTLSQARKLGFRKNWIAQDKDGALVYFTRKPKHSPNELCNWWYRDSNNPRDLVQERGMEGKYNPNWETALVNLRTHGWKLNKNGNLIPVPKRAKP